MVGFACYTLALVPASPLGRRRYGNSGGLVVYALGLVRDLAADHRRRAARQERIDRHDALAGLDRGGRLRHLDHPDVESFRVRGVDRTGRTAERERAVRRSPPVSVMLAG